MRKVYCKRCGHVMLEPSYGNEFHYTCGNCGYTVKSYNL